MSSLRQIHESNFLDLASAALRQAGGRMTAPRRAVIECLAAAVRPMSIQEIFDKLTKGNKTYKLDRVSVYRIVEALQGKGLVHPVGSSGKYLACFHSECHAGQHVILSCLDCQSAREVDLPKALTKSLESFLKQEQSFLNKDHGIVIEGYCAVCAKKKTS
jgi:Fe2+ or Zn2+ uptake regulation protein